MYIYIYLYDDPADECIRLIQRKLCCCLGTILLFSFPMRFFLQKKSYSPVAFFSRVFLGLSPLPVTVTTRIITFLVGDPNLNLHFRCYWEGGQPKVFLQDTFANPLQFTVGSHPCCFFPSSLVSLRGGTTSECLGWC